MGLREARDRLVHCSVLNTCHVTADFTVFAVRESFNSHVNGHRTLWLNSALYFIGGLLTYKKMVHFQGSQATLKCLISKYRPSGAPFSQLPFFFNPPHCLCLLHKSLSRPHSRAACAAAFLCAGGGVRGCIVRH